jgi:hypothetical protein
MKTTIENIVTAIPSLAAQLFTIGGALAIIGATLFALAFMWQRHASRAASKSEPRPTNRRPAPSLEIARPGRAKRGLAAAAEQLAAAMSFEEEGIAELFSPSGGLARRVVLHAAA